MKKYLYVDSENTGLQFISLLKKIDESWKVYLFYSDKSPKLTFTEMHSFLESGCRYEMISCRNGRPNAMDFCIMTQLGMAVRKHPKGMHLVLSRDKGFLSGVELLKAQGFLVGQIVMDDETGAFSWVSQNERRKQYDEITEFLIGPVPLELPPPAEERPARRSRGGRRRRSGSSQAAANAQGAGPSDAVSSDDAAVSGGMSSAMEGTAADDAPRGAQEMHGSQAGSAAGMTAGSTAVNAGQAVPADPMSESAVERVMVRVLGSRFESVGVDRRRRKLGQILSRGLHNALQGGVLKFDIMENALRKFALFRNDPDMVLRFLEALEEHPELKIVNTVDARAIPVTGEEVPEPAGAEMPAAAADSEAGAEAQEEKLTGEQVAEAFGEAVPAEAADDVPAAEAVTEVPAAEAAEAEAPAAKPRRRRGRRKKSETEAAVEVKAEAAAEKSAAEALAETVAAEEKAEIVAEEASPAAEVKAEAAVKETPAETAEVKAEESEAEVPAAKPRRRRTRRKKSEAETAAAEAPAVEVKAETAEAEAPAAEVKTEAAEAEVPAAEAKAEAAEAEASAAEETPAAKPRRSRTRRKKNEAEAAAAETPVVEAPAETAAAEAEAPAQKPKRTHRGGRRRKSPAARGNAQGGSGSTAG